MQTIENLKQRINLANQILMGGISTETFLEFVNIHRRMRLYENFITDLDKTLSNMTHESRQMSHIALETHKVLNEAKLNIEEGYEYGKF